MYRKYISKLRPQNKKKLFYGAFTDRMYIYYKIFHALNHINFQAKQMAVYIKHILNAFK